MEYIFISNSQMGNMNKGEMQPPMQGLRQQKINFHYIKPIQYNFDDLFEENQSVHDKQNINRIFQSKAITSKNVIDIKNSSLNKMRNANMKQIEVINNTEEKIDTMEINEIDIEKLQLQDEQEENEQVEELVSKNIEEVRVKWNLFIKMKKKNYLEDYKIIGEIGRGGFGCVYKSLMKYTGLYRAAKKIKKSTMGKEEHEKLFAQTAIMMSLDHPNIIKLYEVYDYKAHYILILELCNGGELHRRVVNRTIRENEAARIIKQLMRSLIYLHSQGIVHRDLKPQNMLFEKQTNLIKIIDFGIAVKKKEGEVLSSRLGTPYYIAPEVILKNYDEKCDIWSVGVILYMIIVGYPPFRGDTQEEVLEKVLKEPILYRGGYWADYSSQCKDFLYKLLMKNPKERLSARQAIQHPWLLSVQQYQESLSASNKKNNKTQNNIYRRINSFHFKNVLQAVVHTYVVSQLLSSAERLSLLQFFKEVDLNKDGVISKSELLHAIKQRADTNTNVQKIEKLLKIIDTNSSGMIQYTQFLVAGIQTSVITKEHLERAFAYFDIDHSGCITIEEVAEFLDSTNENSINIRNMFDLVDQNKDGYISKEQFVVLLSQQLKPIK